jgi:hypothetical protein
LLKPARMPPSRDRAALVIAALLAAAALVAPAPARAGDSGERITALAAGAHTLFALRGNTVVSFDDAGREVGRCGRFEAAPPPHTVAPARSAIDAQEALRIAGLPEDDRETVEAEDLLDDEGLTPRRQPRPVSEPPIVAHAVAASPASDDVWIATSGGLFRGHAGACRRVALSRRDAVAVAAAPGALAVASEQLLWRSDGDGALRVVAGLTARPRALAIIDEQRTLVATDDAVVEVGPHGVARTVLDRGADAIAFCGGDALAFARDGVWAWTGEEPPRRAGDRPAARTLACGDGGDARFVAMGGGLYASPDGSVWRQRRAWPGRSVDAAAVVGGRIWVAVDGAPIPADDTRAAEPARPPAPGRATVLPALAPIPTARLAGPLFPWPQLTLVFSSERAPLRGGWSVLLLIGFRLGRASTSPVDRRRLADELLRRDAELAAQERKLAAPDGDDPSRSARLRALRQEREALR